MLVTTAMETLLGVGCLSTKADCAPAQAESEFVSNHIWHCHHTVISCPDTNSTATRSWRSNWIFSERVWRFKGTVTVPYVIFYLYPPSIWWEGTKLNFKWEAVGWPKGQHFWRLHSQDMAYKHHNVWLSFDLCIRCSLLNFLHYFFFLMSPC